MISDIFAKESIISYFRSDIIGGPADSTEKSSKLDSIRAAQNKEMQLFRMPSDYSILLLLY